jgi:hypothetical protein
MFLEGLITSLPSSQTGSITNDFGCIMLENNIETSNITITPTNQICHMDINHYFSNNILYIIVIIQKNNKKQQNTQQNTQPNTQPNTKYIINYGNCNIELSSMKYNLYIMTKSNASINKKIKKQCLTPLNTLLNISNTNSLFLLDSKIFFNIDHNGDIFYYPDSIEQYTISPNTETTIYNSNLSSKKIADYFYEDDTSTTIPITTPSDFKTLLDKHEYIEIPSSNISSNISITNSYLLNELPNLSLHLSNNSNGFCQISNANGSNGSNVLFGISSLLNWFNPWSYYYSQSTNNTTSSNAISETTQNTQTTQTILQSPVLEGEPVKYYICSKSMNIIKVTSISSSVKVLRPKLLDIPIQIENIKIDDLENVIIEGKNTEINKKMSIQFNKFMLNQTKQIVS